MPDTTEPEVSWPRRLAWFLGLGLAGLLLTAGVAYGLRALLLA